MRFGASWGGSRVGKTWQWGGIGQGAMLGEGEARGLGRHSHIQVSREGKKVSREGVNS